MITFLFKPIGWVLHILFAILQTLFYPVLCALYFLMDFDWLRDLNFRDYMQYEREDGGTYYYTSRWHFLFGQEPFKTEFREESFDYWP